MHLSSFNQMRVRKFITEHVPGVFTKKTDSYRASTQRQTRKVVLNLGSLIESSSRSHELVIVSKATELVGTGAGV